MTHALYHDDALLLDFPATVAQVRGHDVALDATAFYPEGGGQNGDQGRWRWTGPQGHPAQARVVATRKDKATGTVWHTLDGEVPDVGQAVSGEVDRAPRWHNMQRHSAEHLLAQAFVRVGPAFQVVSVSMAGPECHLDLRGEPGPEQVQAAETLLRETLGRDELTLETPVVPETDLGLYPLRRETKVKDRVRLVMFRQAGGEWFDVSACGGTHVPRAAMCAPVVVLRTERIKGGLTRVTFMAGEEAGAYLSGVYQEARRLSQRLSVPVERVAERVQAVLTEQDTVKAELEHLHAELARQAVAAQPPEPVGAVMLRVVPLSDAAQLMPALTGLPVGEVRAVVCPQGRCGVASGVTAVSAQAVLRAALTETGGKGGGKPELAQGQTTQPEAFAGAVRAALAAQQTGA